MADNVDVTPGAGATIAADEVTIGGNVVKTQRFKQVVGKDGTYIGDVSGRNVDGDANASATFVDPRTLAKRISVTPVITTAPAYTAKDAIGALLTFASAARASGGSFRVNGLQVVDLSQQMPAMDLVLFNTAITAPTDNAVFDPADADMHSCVGVIEIPHGPGDGWADFNDNSVYSLHNMGLEVVLSATADLTAVLVARGTPTFVSVSDIVVSLTLIQD